MSRIAIVQLAPVFLDRAATLGKAIAALDVAGHYARPDLFRLQVDHRPQLPVTETRTGDAS